MGAAYQGGADRNLSHRVCVLLLKS